MFSSKHTPPSSRKLTMDETTTKKVPLPRKDPVVPKRGERNRREASLWRRKESNPFCSGKALEAAEWIKLLTFSYGAIEAPVTRSLSYPFPSFPWFSSSPPPSFFFRGCPSGLRFHSISSGIIPNYAVLTMAVITTFNCLQLRPLGGAWPCARPPAKFTGWGVSDVTTWGPCSPLVGVKCVVCSLSRDWPRVWLRHQIVFRVFSDQERWESDVTKEVTLCGGGGGRGGVVEVGRH